MRKMYAFVFVFVQNLKPIPRDRMPVFTYLFPWILNDDKLTSHQPDDVNVCLMFIQKLLIKN